MRIRKRGKICDGLWFFGWEESCVYLLEGKNRSLLINGGFSCLIPDLLRQLESSGIDESRINALLVLHSHFDHVGIVPFFKLRHPDMVVYSSPRALEIFKKPKAIQVINTSSRYITESRGLSEVCSAYDLDWWTGIEGGAVSEGDRIDLGDLEVHIIETPGHSLCSISAYVPQMKALFPSDAGGVPLGERIVIDGTSNFTKFEESLQKLKGLEVEYLCSDHYGYVTGADAGAFISDSIEAAKRRRCLMEEAYKRTGDLEEAARQLASLFRYENSANIVPNEVYLQSQRRMIMNVVGLA
jgi:glyoxylase-like metal-dependent hydrolase (beta-lactamase superfamily II)